VLSTVLTYLAVVAGAVVLLVAILLVLMKMFPEGDGYNPDQGGKDK
jgi:hypothetical protein